MKTLISFLPYDLTPYEPYMPIYNLCMPRIWAYTYTFTYIPVNVYKHSCTNFLCWKNITQNVPLTPDKLTESQNQAKNKQ